MGEGATRSLLVAVKTLNNKPGCVQGGGKVWEGGWGRALDHLVITALETGSNAEG